MNQGIETGLNRETLAAIQLNLISGLGPRLQSLLLGRFGTASQIFQASGSELLSVSGIGPKVSAEITRHRDLAQAETEWRQANELGISLIPRDDPAYPQGLLEICDPPPILYVHQQLLPTDALAVAIVGSRNCTHYGRTQAAKLAAGLARSGVVVVSGLARGIDAAAHQGALEAGGRTIAVCAPGLLNIYPVEHAGLARQISQQGAMVTESPLHRGPVRGLFPQRNRIIAGLSLGVIIVEASRKSGALHTARHAMEQGRDVFAVPGRVDSSASDGCHDLIRDGAMLIRGVDDVFESLGPLMKPVTTAEQQVIHTPRELTLNEQELSVLNLIDTAPTPIDQLLTTAEMPAARVLSTLTVLEMKRLIRRLPGSCVERIPG